MTKTTNIISALLPVITVVGLIVLVALGKIDQAAVIGLIGALAGVHAARSGSQPPGSA